MSQSDSDGWEVLTACSEFTCEEGEEPGERTSDIAAPPESEKQIVDQPAPKPIDQGTQTDLCSSDSPKPVFSTLDEAEIAKLTEPWKCYVVWAVPGADHLRGVWVSGDWYSIEKELPQKRYNYRWGHRLRKFKSIATAYRGYLGEAELHGAPVPPTWH